MFMEDTMLRKTSENDAVCARSFDSENRNFIEKDGIYRPQGEIFDYFIFPDGHKELIHHGKNIVVDSCSKVIACLIKAHAGYSGATYWAVGSGSAAWSNETPPSPAATDAALTTETYRKAIVPSTDIVFLDASNNVTATVTNKIQITVTFLEAEANGELREFGIFGGNASSTLGSGLMINHKIHPLIYKTNTLQLQRVLRLTF